MKTKTLDYKRATGRKFVLAITGTVLLYAGSAYSQPGPRIDPATGMPESSPGEITPVSAFQDASQTANDVRTLIFNNQYEDALQRCLAFHDKYKASGSLTPLLSDWVELGRRFPKAKEALIKIRDHDMHEFAEGRGYSDLFSEVNSIDEALQQDDVTYKLFKSFRDKDPQLAQQCYFYVEGLLVAKGDYRWCYDHMGDAQDRLNSITQSYAMQLESQKRMAAMNEMNRQRMADMNRQHGWTNLPSYSPPDTSAMLKRSAENNFISQTRRLISILVGSGHKAEAEKIRDQAVATLDSDRLKSAVADAEAKIQD